eukprot:GHVH01011727.1.p1 GENE.GHVH01011727.1~~GHVH01011727.1.p1  ORF type:complete len:186 (+),score=13.72 GHVH01011727.1:193-750(+)
MLMKITIINLLLIMLSLLPVVTYASAWNTKAVSLFSTGMLLDGLAAKLRPSDDEVIEEEEPCPLKAGFDTAILVQNRYSVSCNTITEGDVFGEVRYRELIEHTIPDNQVEAISKDACIDMITGPNRTFFPENSIMLMEPTTSSPPGYKCKELVYDYNIKVRLHEDNKGPTKLSGIVCGVNSDATA